MSGESHIAVVNDYHGLQRAMRARAEALQVSRAVLGEIAGTSEGHVGKLLAEIPKKNMGITSLGLVLQALGLELVVRENAEQMQKLAHRLVPRTAHQVRERKPVVEAAANG